jgi:hypothetical protein
MSRFWQRIKRVENTLIKKSKQRTQANQVGKTAEEWLVAFEAMGGDGQLGDEPDFTQALAYYRDAVCNPAPHFYYRHAGQLRELPESYRGRSHVRVADDGTVLPDGANASQGVCCRVFCAADEGWSWLAGIVLRDADGGLPVTEAEYQELTDWLDHRLRNLDLAAFERRLIDVRTAGGSSCLMTPFNLWLIMRDRGPRDVGAAERADAVRRLQKQYGEGDIGCHDTAANSQRG